MSDYTKLHRYGLQWNGPKEFVATPKSDGYWMPWHIADEQITTLRQQLEQAEAKVDLFRRACEDLMDDRPIERAFFLRKQAEAVEALSQNLKDRCKIEYRRWVAPASAEMDAEAQRLRQQADEAERGSEFDEH